MPATISPIPVQNLYYLLCYAWQRLEEAEKIQVGEFRSDSLLDLLTYILLRGTKHLLKRGFDRSYIEVSEEAPSIRGKIDLARSLRGNLLSRGRAVCEYSELSYDVPQNQILKSTLRALVHMPDLDADLRQQLVSLLRLLHEIKEVRLTRALFRSVSIHRNNQFYDFLMKVCELVFENRALLEDEGRGALPDFIRDQQKLQRLFERFVFNFYDKHTDFHVRREVLQWLGTSASAEAQRYLPTMHTDISLESSERKIIVDTKFYKEALTKSQYGQKLNSGNLYQIFAYLKNPKATDCAPSREGLLLYPTVDQELDLDYELSGHRVLIRTVNLNQDWRKIHARLLEVVAVPVH